MNESLHENLRAALALGDPEQVAALIRAGADVRYQREDGYDALTNAIYGRYVQHDARLIELLTLLIENGVSLTGMSIYGESGLRALSRWGRFDAVRLLLNAGANPAELEMTPLMEAVAFGSLADVERVVAQGAVSTSDNWSSGVRTPCWPTLCFSHRIGRSVLADTSNQISTHLTPVRIRSLMRRFLLP